MILLSDNVFDVNERVLRNHTGEVLWRISLTTDAPLSINYFGLSGLAAQLDLTPADLKAVLGTENFPPQLTQLGQPPRPIGRAQWAYKAAVAALIELQGAKELKEWEVCVPE